MDKNPLVFDICMMYGYFVKSLPGRCSDFLFFFFKFIIIIILKSIV